MKETSVDKKKRFSIGNTAALLITTALIGQLLGFLRTKLVNANFPLTGVHSTDSYFAAFIIPDFFFFTLAAGALGVAFMPVLSDRIFKYGRKAGWELASSLMNFLIIIMALVGVIIIVFAEPLVLLVAPGLAHNPVQLHDATAIMRFIAFNPLLFTISGVLTSVQQTLGRFFFFAIAPLFYNLAIIISIFVFKDSVGIVGLGIGALIGAILQLIVVAFGVARLNYHWRPKIMWGNKEFNTVLRNLPPRAIDQGMDQINDVVETHIASNLASGSISNFNNAYILSMAPTMLIGQAISTAAFPKLNARLSQGRPDLFRRDFLMVLRAMIWIAAPLVVIGYFGRGYLARMIYAQGNPQVAIIFGFLSVAIFFRIMYTIMSRWFYAQKDTKTPLYISLFTIALNVVLAYALARPSMYGVAGLALAQSIVTTIEVFIMAVIMVIRDHRLFDATFWSGVWRIISVTGFTVVTTFIMISFFPLGAEDKGFFVLGGKLLLIAAVAMSVHIALSSLFGLDEVKPVFRRVKQFALKTVNFGS